MIGGSVTSGIFFISYEYSKILLNKTQIIDPIIHTLSAIIGEFACSIT